ncbi:bacteriocin ABC transporter ATP-binding protein [Terribacillus saccharophilus]|uniref:peptidase domain-containing ABC transporter n=1 Tax=Terribacillus saccharophilus TaxID=361277 RepID=UPI000BA65892|nr:peptide cleavage/export ABC transporter [Terribacillus saccharophilus]PAF36732.1 bacteriocin ABC transporter ATP-binding protein [Terribacillus saccharophilus]
MNFRRYHCVKQLDETDCGAACLATILRHYGSKKSITKIRDIASTDTDGTNVLGMIEAAEALGFSSKGYKADKSVFEQQLSLPAIAHVMLEGKLLHYVVIHKVKKEKIIVADPGKGLITYNKEDFFDIWTGILIFMVPSENYKKQVDESNVRRDLFKLVFSQKSIIVHTAIASFIIAIFGILGTFFFQTIIDQILPNGLENTLHIISIGLIVMYIFQVVLSAFRQYLLILLGQKLSISIMLGYFKHVLKLPMKFFSTRKDGEILARFTDASKVIDAIVSASLSSVLDILMLIIVGVVLYIQNSSLFFITLCLIPLYIINVWLFIKPYEDINNKEMENNAQLTSKIVETLRSIETIKAYNAEDSMSNETEKRFVRLLKSSYKHDVIDNIQNSLKMFLDLASGALILWIGAIQVMEGNITIGQLITYNALLAYFLNPLQNIIGLQSTLQSATVASKRLGEILDAEPEIQESKFTVTNPALISGGIVLDDVNFRYGTREKVLKNISLNIARGEKIAFIGESGSGKSTLTKLLMNFYQAESGSILFNGYNIKDIDIIALRETISFIPQEPHFIQGSILENLLMGNTEMISFEEVIEICKQTNLHDFINDLPRKYDTIVDEDGANFSGGQRQRLAIARALLRKPSILIMDESTSSLDSTTEQGITNMVYDLADNITTIMIAHRLSTVMRCGRIVVMEKGEIIEQGSHDDLLDRKGKYFELWENQMPYKLEVTS